MVINMERIAIHIAGDDEELDELADFLEEGSVSFGRGMVYSDGMRPRKVGEEYVWETQGEIFHPIGFDLNKGVVKRLDAWLRKPKAGRARQRLWITINDAKIMTLDEKALDYLNGMLDGSKRLPAPAGSSARERRLVSLAFPVTG